MPALKTHVSQDTKAGFADLARRHGVSQSMLLGAMAEHLLQIAPAKRDSLAGQLAKASPARREGVTRRATPKRERGRQIKLRLWGEEQDAVERLAAAEARSVPAWIVALVRRTALHVTPFAQAELRELQHAIAALGPLGRNVNQLCRHWHQTGEIDPHKLQIMDVAKVIAELRREVLRLADRAVRRYTPSE